MLTINPPNFRHLTLLTVLICGGLSAADADPAAELTTIRDALRTKLDAKIKADSAKETPRVFSLGFDTGLGRGEMRVELHRLGGNFIVTSSPSGLGAGMQLRSIDPSGLVLDKDRLTGPLSISWRKDLGIGENAEVGEVGAEEKQVFAVNASIKSVDRRLVLTFHRFVGKTLTLNYRAEGSGWVQEDAPNDPKWIGGPWGDFSMRCSPLVVDAAGSFTGDIEFTMVYDGRGDESVKNWNSNGLPKVRFTGRINEGWVDTTWLLQAPGGKHMFGSGRDLLSGAIQEQTIVGRYHSTGQKGEWIGAVQGSVLPASTSLSLLEELAPMVEANNPAAPLVRAAGLYRQILILDQCLRRYPLPIQEAINRVKMPQPVLTAEAAKDPQTAAGYLNGVLAQARSCLDETPAKIAVGAVRPKDLHFGPYTACSILEGNGLSAVKSDPGPQEWRFIADWRCIGPFEVHDQEIEQPYPSVMPVASVGASRSRIFWTDIKTGGIDTVTDVATWAPASMDGSLVFAPEKPEFSTGCMRFFDWYATTTITSASEQQANLAIQLRGQATLWLNGTRVWDSGRDYNDLNHTVLPVKFLAGENRVLLRVASNRTVKDHFGRIDWFDGFKPRPQGSIDFTTFRMHVCLKGSPAAEGTPKVASAATPSPLSLGFRGDGTGVYPDAQPPLAWDLEKNINVGWKTVVPFGAADMVVKDGKIFVPAEPRRLICLDATTGKELWHLDAKVGDTPKETKEKSFLTVTPVLIGDKVIAHFGSGSTLCAGTDGTLAWEVDTGLRWTEPNMGSPIIVGKVLVVQGNLPAEKGKKDPTKSYALIGLDVSTGKTLWTTTCPVKRVLIDHDRAAGFGNGYSLMRLGEKNLLVTTDGAVVDAANGELVLRDVLLHEANRAAPAILGDTAYFAPVLGEEATQFWIDEANRVAARTLWQNPPNYGRGQVKTVTGFGTEHWMKGPLVKDGQMYVVRVDSSHVPQHHPCPWTQLDSYDLATGRKTYRYRAVLRDQTDPTIPPVLAGKFLLVGDGGDGVAGFQGTNGYGMIAMVELGKEPFTVARSKTGMFRASPVPDGKRLFLRQYDSVVCLEVQTDQGRKYQNEMLAENILGEISEKPVPPPMLRLQASSDFSVLEGTPVCRLLPRVMPTDWLFLGPIPKATVGDPLATIGGQAASCPGPNTIVKIDGKDYPFKTLDQQFVGRDKYKFAENIDIFGPINRKGESIAYYFTVIDNPRVQVLQFKNSSSGVEVWFAGKPLTSDSFLHLGIGRYPLLVKVTLGRLPPVVKELRIATTFITAQDPGSDYGEWVTRVETNRPHLERIIKELPQTQFAFRATQFLNQAKNFRERHKNP